MITMLKHILSRFRPSPVPWAPTGYTYRHGRTYDERKALDGARRARRHTATGRPLPRPRPQEDLY